MARQCKSFKGRMAQGGYGRVRCSKHRDPFPHDRVPRPQCSTGIASRHFEGRTQGRGASCKNIKRLVAFFMRVVCIACFIMNGGVALRTTLTVRGQTVIPASIRKAYGLKSNTKLEWIEDGKCIRVIPLTSDTICEARGVFGKTALRRSLLRSRAKDNAGG